MDKTMRLCGVLLCAASLSACATVTRGTRQAYVIETDPPGAQVQLSTGQSCVTPCALRLKRRPGFTVDITREGYEPVHATVASGISGGGGAAMAGNVILGGLIGAAVDGASGAMNDLRPNPLRVSMVPLAAAAAAVGETPAADEAADEAPAEGAVEAPSETPEEAPGGEPIAAPEPTPAPGE